MSDIERCCECCGGDGTDAEWFIGAEGEDVCARCSAESLGAERDALRQQLRGAVDTLRHVLESAEHPSLTVRSTSYIAKVARDYLDSLGGQ